MTSEQFTYWLQGYFEVGHPKTLNEQQVQIIKDHLDLVFKKITPNYIMPQASPYCDNYKFLLNPHDHVYTIC
jgi:hypothetical protein